MIQDGLRDVVQAELTDRGYRPEMVRDFVGDMAALPGAMVVQRRLRDAVHGRPTPTTPGRIGEREHAQETLAITYVFQLCHSTGCPGVTGTTQAQDGGQNRRQLSSRSRLRRLRHRPTNGRTQSNK